MNGDQERVPAVLLNYSLPAPLRRGISLNLGLRSPLEAGRLQKSPFRAEATNRHLQGTCDLLAGAEI